MSSGSTLWNHVIACTFIRLNIDALILWEKKVTVPYSNAKRVILNQLIIPNGDFFKRFISFSFSSSSFLLLSSLACLSLILCIRSSAILFFARLFNPEPVITVSLSSSLLLSEILFAAIYLLKESRVSLNERKFFLLSAEASLPSS